MGTALVVGLLVGMCGGIAYIGDLLGRRMGKKRLSVFGLRPRHTAVVFTVITGMVIAAVTLGALLLLSRGVRIAVTRGEQLLYDNHRLKQERRGLDRQRAQLIAQKDELEAANADLVHGNSALRTAGDRLRAETSGLQQHNRALQAKNVRLTERSQRLGTRNERLVQSNWALISRNGSLAAKNGQLVRANRRIAGTNTRLTLTNQALKASSIRLNLRNHGLQIEKAGLERARDRTQIQLTRLRGDLDHTRHDLTEAQKELTNAAKLMANEHAHSTRADQMAEELAEGKVIVHRGEELARRVLLPGASVGTVRSTLQELLDAADAEVARREERAPGGARRVGLDPHGAPADQLLEQTAMELMTESHPVAGRDPATPMPEIHPLVLRAIASQNAAARVSDPVSVDVSGQVNRLAFRRGEEVGYLDVETATTSGQLLKSLVTFLQQQVREAAIERSVLPDALGSVGEIDYESLLDVIGKVKRLPGTVRVGAVAAMDAWTAGPLRLEFYVVPHDARVANEKR